MGYTTEFSGQVTIEPPLNENEISFINDLSSTRRMNRSNGPLFVGGSGYYGQGHDADVIDFNNPHRDQPGLWCQWVANDEGTTLSWDGGEKFYYSAEWMRYIIDNLLAPSAGSYLLEHNDEDERLRSFTYDHKLNGVIDAEGEERSDVWQLTVKDNVVS